MSAGIETQGDMATFVAVARHGWHKLGKVSSVDLSYEEGLKLANLKNLEYQLQRTWTATPSLDEWIETQKYAIIRRNPFNREQWEALGVGFSEGYQVHTPEDTAEFGQAIIEQGHPLSALGSIKDGRMFFAAYRLDNIQIGGKDQVNMFLNVITSFDGSTSTITKASGIRAECENTTGAILREVGMPTYRVRHVGDPLLNHVDAARASLEIGWQGLELFQAEADRMIEREVTAGEFDKIVAAAFPIGEDLGDRAKANREAERAEVRRVYEASPTTEFIRGTAWGAYNAITEYLDHTSGNFQTPENRMAARILPGSSIDNRRLDAGGVINRVLKLGLEAMA